MAVSPDSIASDGSQTSTITVTLKDAEGNALEAGGSTVTVEGLTKGTIQTGGASDAVESLVTPGKFTLHDNSNGTYTGVFVGNTKGTQTITAKLGGVAISSTADITLTPGAATQLYVSDYPGSRSEEHTSELQSH